MACDVLPPTLCNMYSPGGGWINTFVWIYINISVYVESLDCTGIIIYRCVLFLWRIQWLDNLQRKFGDCGFLGAYIYHTSWYMY